MSNIERAISMWREAIEKIWQLLTESPASWNSDVYGVISNIHAAFNSAATALVVMFFLYGLTRKSINLQDYKRPEVFFSQFIRLGIVTGVVAGSFTLLEAAFEVVQSMLSVVKGSAKLDVSAITLPQEIETALNNTNMIEIHPFSSDKIDLSGIKVALFGLIAMVVIFVCSIMLLVIVYGRLINLYLHMAVSGIFLSTFAAEQTQGIGAAFIKSWLNSCLRALVMILAVFIYSKLISSDSSEAVKLVTAGDVTGGLMLYMKEFLVFAFITISVCKAGDQIVQRWGL